ncbi:hypothetical protein B0H16DRAFT_525160 [Mycena metata]|uniref:Nephrocystin-3 n=1 Tax=Mycena metata TaxID=1033252 RepID=A0AAD7H824_9AGAR|nr:hypothetical protein B0H16DRAFT_525160 [Mycena metata]
MSTASLPTSGSPAPPTAGGTILRPFKVPPKSKSDWLAPAILTAKTITAAAECAPFPYIQGVSGTVLILLETVVAVKNNREDLEELCNSATEIITILHDQILAHGNTAAVKFKGLCEELESYLEAAILAIRNLQDESKGFRGRFKEFLKSSSLTDEIVGYQTQIQGVCSKLKLMAIVETNFKVNELHTMIMAPIENINNCPRPSRIFQGRQAMLDKMHQFFNTDSGNQHIYVLYGLGGAGKTQIALKFIEESSFSNFFLVDTSKVETIETGLKSIAVSKSVGDSVQDALMWLQSNRNKWLLFFDNADDPKINLNDFVPKCNHGNIIITSRNPERRSYGAHTLVSDMEEADATTLLLHRANQESSEENLKLAAEIVKELYYLPLAIVQAGAFISKSEDLEGYLALYLSNRARLLSEKAALSHDGYAQTVFTTWQSSFNQLSHLAATFLQLCSFLHYTGISEDMFCTASKYDFPLWSPPREELQEPLEFLSQFLGPTGEWNSLKFLDVTNEIRAYSLISFDAKTKLFSLHPLVHAWSRSTLLDEEPLQSCMSSILGMCITKIPGHEITLASVQLISHLVLLKSVNPDGGADFRRAFWRIYYNGGKLQDAQGLAEQVLEKSQLLLGEDHPHTLLAMSNFALTCAKQGEFRKAEEVQVLVLEKHRKLLGEDHPGTLLAMGNLARTYSGLGEFRKAEELGVLVLEKRTKLLGEDHPSTLSAMGNLASIYSDLGEFQKAKELEVLVLEKCTKLLGEDHPDTLLTIANLARTYSGLGEFWKAEELGVLVLKKRTKLLGEDHPDTLLTMGNLASIYSDLGEFQKAKELEVLVLEKRTKLLGEDHPDTLLTIANLARTYSGLGEFQEAEELGVLVLEKRTKLLREDHPDTLRAMANLAASYHSLGDFNKAQSLGVEVLQKQRQLLGDKHPDTILAMDVAAGSGSRDEKIVQLPVSQVEAEVNSSIPGDSERQPLSHISTFVICSPKSARVKPPNPSGLTSEDVQMLQAESTRGGHAVMVYRPEAVVLWLQVHNEHPLIKAIQCRHIGGPIAAMLAPDAPCLVIFGSIHDGWVVKAAKLLADESQFAVMIRPLRDNPKFVWEQGSGKDAPSRATSLSDHNSPGTIEENDDETDEGNDLDTESEGDNDSTDNDPSSTADLRSALRLRGGTAPDYRPRLGPVHKIDVQIDVQPTFGKTYQVDLQTRLQFKTQAEYESKNKDGYRPQIIAWVSFSVVQRSGMSATPDRSYSDISFLVEHQYISSCHV